MVGNLTVGKKGYEPVWKDMAALALRAQEVKARLLAAVDEDTLAFKALMEAMKLPKSSPAEAGAREAAVEEGYKRASLVPLATAEACLEAIRLCHDAVRSGNRNSASDGGVGALMARAGLDGAVLNIGINLVPLRDESFKAELRSRTASLRAEARSLCDAVLESVMASIGE
jgi:formiminotetrahydrofolate cyclodeaminase